MEGTVKKRFIDNWPRKLLALVMAICLWFVIDYSITATRIFTRVPVRVVNLPPDKTIRGLMPNGMLDRHLTLTLTGTKDVIDKIEPGDFEVVIDASGKGDEWIAQIGKKNLVSLNPDIDLIHNVTALSHSAFVMRLSKLVTDKIPIHIMPPKGEPPQGYQFLDIWPQKLTHVISGPEEDVRQLQLKGIDLTFDLSDITAEDLDNLKGGEHKQRDEVSFYVPEGWKRVSIPFLHDIKQEINGPEARYLRIDFLRKALLPIDSKIPIRVFYPLATSTVLNPITRPLETNHWIASQNGIMVVTQNLFTDDVSRFFLDIVKNNIELVIIAAEGEKNGILPVSVQFIDPKRLEDTYVALVLAAGKDKEDDVDQLHLDHADPHRMQRQHYLRARFRNYMQYFQLFVDKEKLFVVRAFLEESNIRIAERND
jgi:hypothetical protein